MKKIFKDYTYLSMLIGVFIAFVTFVTLFFVTSRGYFTIMFIVNIILNFTVAGFILLLNDKKTPSLRFKCLSLYLVSTLFFLIIDVVTINNIWNLDSYSNLMYVKNIELYLSIYSMFVLVMVLMSIYVVLKNLTNISKSNIRQKSAKQ